MARGATCFPQALALASSWNPELVYELADTIRQDMVNDGAHLGLGPVLDIGHDPRWGRIEETYGEDPLLVASLGTAYVRGLQGEDLRHGILATAKHFLGYAASEGARNLCSVSLGTRELERHLYPFECAIRAGGLQSVMVAYHDLDGIPCAGSRELLTDLLRGNLGFDGMVVADYGVVMQLFTNHRVVADKEAAACLAMTAGLDSELPKGDCYLNLEAAVTAGRLPVAVIDLAVRRTLTAKARLGLLTGDRRKPISRPRVLDTEERRRLARRAALESIVLLKNNGILPLRQPVTILLTGPNADDKHALLGDYSMTSLSGFFLKTIPGWNELRVPTVYEALRQALPPAVGLEFAPGCDRESVRRDSFAAAVELARHSEIILAVMGEDSISISGEGRDRADIRLPGVQEELLQALAATGKPLVLILLNGRPLDLGKVESLCEAIVEAWYPGEEGGAALADILLGAANPSGKLAVNYLQEAGQAPLPYAGRSQGREGLNNAWCRGGTPVPLYSFGHGLSYTTFDYSDLQVVLRGSGADQEVEVSCVIRNSGPMTGTEVAQLYIRDEVASVAPLMKMLKNFGRVSLAPGESKKVRFRTPTELLAFRGRDLRLVVEAGDYSVLIGTSAADIRLTGSFTLQDNRILERREYFLGTATVEG
jgi:beta-glucosidase